MPDESKPNPLHRLSEAVAAFLEFETKALSKDEVLEKHTQLRDLLEPMFEDNEAGSPAEPTSAGDRYLGDYRLLREIGRGGMGVVYEAEDTALGRRVALKVLLPTMTQSPRQIERFRREAAAAARLEHPGIVPIYNVGEAAGSHYFAMEYVAGPSLHRALDAVRGTHPHFAAGFGDADFRAGFTGSYVTQAVEIVAQAAEAVATAHAGAVIHRDLKPHNLLLTGSGRVRVVDFGLAKDLDRATISQSQEIAGTPHYMSPEQISGLRDVDHRTDIYALGVVLYELLSLQCPFEAESMQGLILSIATQEPKALRKLSPRTPRDVEIICHKAMEKDPAHRYQTAADLAADLRRFLDHEPIVAQPPSTFTRVIQLVRRRRAASAAVALAILLPIVATVFYFVFYRPTSDALAQERTETEKVQRQGDETFREARDLLAKHLRRAIELSKQPGMMKMSRGMMEEALVALERLKAHKARFPSHSEILGQAYLQLGAARFRFGENELALADFERGFQILDELSREHPAFARYEYLRAQSLSWLGLVRNELGGMSEAEENHREAIAVLEKLLESSSGVSENNVKALLVKCYLGLGISVFRDSKRLEESIAAFERSLAMHASLPEEVRKESDMVSFQIEALRSSGRAHSARGDWKRAEAVLLDAKRVCEFAISNDEPPSARRRELGRIHLSLGRVRQSTRRDEQAEQDYRNAVVVFRAVHEDFPELVPCINSLARSLRDLGLVQGKLRRFDEADRSLREAVRVAELIPNNDLLLYRSVLASSYAALALSRSRTVSSETLQEVDGLFQKATGIQTELVERVPNHAGHKHQLALSLHNHAALLLAVRQATRAGETAQRAIEHQLAALALRPGNLRYRQMLALHYWALADAELQLGNHEGAERATRNALERAGTSLKFVYTGAKNFARCAALAAVDSGLIPLERDEVVERLCKAAVQYLQLALEKKLPIETARREAAFEILRTRDDWKRLMER